MDDTPMPEPLRRAIHQLVSEAVMNCQEVLRYTQPDQTHDWQRMTLYRASDAEDTMDMVSMLIAAYCRHTGTAQDTLESYLQLSRQHSRAAGPTDTERAHLAGLLGEEAPTGANRSGLARMRYARGQRQAQRAQQPDDNPQRLFTEACLHGLRARLYEDVDSLDSYLPPHVAELARKIADVLEEPQRTPRDVVVADAAEPCETGSGQVDGTVGGRVGCPPHVVSGHRTG